METFEISGMKQKNRVWTRTRTSDADDARDHENWDSDERCVWQQPPSNHVTATLRYGRRGARGDTSMTPSMGGSRLVYASRIDVHKILRDQETLRARLSTIKCLKLEGSSSFTSTVAVRAFFAVLRGASLNMNQCSPSTCKRVHPISALSIIQPPPSPEPLLQLREIILYNVTSLTDEQFWVFLAGLASLDLTRLDLIDFGSFVPVARTVEMIRFLAFQAPFLRCLHLSENFIDGRLKSVQCAFEQLVLNGIEGIVFRNCSLSGHERLQSLFLNLAHQARLRHVDGLVLHDVFPGSQRALLHGFRSPPSVTVSEIKRSNEAILRQAALCDDKAQDQSDEDDVSETEAWITQLQQNSPRKWNALLCAATAVLRRDRLLRQHESCEELLKATYTGREVVFSWEQWQADLFWLYELTDLLLYRRRQFTNYRPVMRVWMSDADAGGCYYYVELLARYGSSVSVRILLEEEFVFLATRHCSLAQAVGCSSCVLPDEPSASALSHSQFHFIKHRPSPSLTSTSCVKDASSSVMDSPSCSMEKQSSSVLQSPSSQPDTGLLTTESPCESDAQRRKRRRGRPPRLIQEPVITKQRTSKAKAMDIAPVATVRLVSLRSIEPCCYDSLSHGPASTSLCPGTWVEFPVRNIRGFSTSCLFNHRSSPPGAKRVGIGIVVHVHETGSGILYTVICPFNLVSRDQLNQKDGDREAIDTPYRVKEPVVVQVDHQHVRIHDIKLRPTSWTLEQLFEADIEQRFSLRRRSATMKEAQENLPSVSCLQTKILHTTTPDEDRQRSTLHPKAAYVLPRYNGLNEEDWATLGVLRVKPPTLEPELLDYFSKLCGRENTAPTPPASMAELLDALGAFQAHEALPHPREIFVGFSVSSDVTAACTFLQRLQWFVNVTTATSERDVKIEVGVTRDSLKSTDESNACRNCETVLPGPKSASQLRHGGDVSGFLNDSTLAKDVVSEGRATRDAWLLDSSTDRENKNNDLLSITNGFKSLPPATDTTVHSSADIRLWGLPGKQIVCFDCCILVVPREKFMELFNSDALSRGRRWVRRRQNMRHYHYSERTNCIESHSDVDSELSLSSSSSYASDGSPTRMEAVLSKSSPWLSSWGTNLPQSSKPFSRDTRRRQASDLVRDVKYVATYAMSQAEDFLIRNSDTILKLGHLAGFSVVKDRVVIWDKESAQPSHGLTAYDVDTIKNLLSQCHHIVTRQNRTDSFGDVTLNTPWNRAIGKLGETAVDFCADFDQSLLFDQRTKYPNSTHFAFMRNPGEDAALHPFSSPEQAAFAALTFGEKRRTRKNVTCPSPTQHRGMPCATGSRLSHHPSVRLEPPTRSLARALSSRSRLRHMAQSLQVDPHFLERSLSGTTISNSPSKGERLLAMRAVNPSDPELRCAWRTSIEREIHEEAAWLRSVSSLYQQQSKPRRSTRVPREGYSISVPDGTVSAARRSHTKRQGTSRSAHGPADTAAGEQLETEQRPHITLSTRELTKEQSSPSKNYKLPHRGSNVKPGGAGSVADGHGPQCTASKTNTLCCAADNASNSSTPPTSGSHSSVVPNISANCSAVPSLDSGKPQLPRLVAVAAVPSPVGLEPAGPSKLTSVATMAPPPLAVPLSVSSSSFKSFEKLCSHFSTGARDTIASGPREHEENCDFSNESRRVPDISLSPRPLGRVVDADVSRKRGFFSCEAMSHETPSSSSSLLSPYPSSNYSLSSAEILRGELNRVKPHFPSSSLCSVPNHRLLKKARHATPADAQTMRLLNSYEPDVNDSHDTASSPSSTAASIRKSQHDTSTSVTLSQPLPPPLRPESHNSFVPSQFPPLALRSSDTEQLVSLLATALPALSSISLGQPVAALQQQVGVLLASVLQQQSPEVSSLLNSIFLKQLEEQLRHLLSHEQSQLQMTSSPISQVPTSSQSFSQHLNLDQLDKMLKFFQAHR